MSSEQQIGTSHNLKNDVPVIAFYAIILLQPVHFTLTIRRREMNDNIQLTPVHKKATDRSSFVRSVQLILLTKK